MRYLFPEADAARLGIADGETAFAGATMLWRYDFTSRRSDGQVIFAGYL